MGTAAAAHAHVFLTESGFIIMELVEYLVAHTIGSGGAKLPLTCHLIEACDLAGGCYPAAFAHFWVITVYDVPGGEAGTGRAGYGAGTAGDAAAVVFLPHGVSFKSLANCFVTKIRNVTCNSFFSTKVWM